MGLIPSFPLVHFDFGAIKELAPELANRNIFKPLFLTVQGVVLAQPQPLALDDARARTA